MGDQSYYANCARYAFGIPAALHMDAVVNASDGHTGEPMALEVRKGKPVPQECMVHFDVPAARGWADIIYRCAPLGSRIGRVADDDLTVECGSRRAEVAAK